MTLIILLYIYTVTIINEYLSKLHTSFRSSSSQTITLQKQSINIILLFHLFNSNIMLWYGYSMKMMIGNLLLLLLLLLLAIYISMKNE